MCPSAWTEDNILAYNFLPHSHQNNLVLLQHLYAQIDNQYSGENGQGIFHRPNLIKKQSQAVYIPPFLQQRLLLVLQVSLSPMQLLRTKTCQYYGCFCHKLMAHIATEACIIYCKKY